MLLLIGEAKYMLVFGHSERELVGWKTPNMLYNEDSLLNSYVTLTVQCRWQVPQVAPLENFSTDTMYLRRLAEISASEVQ